MALLNKLILNFISKNTVSSIDEAIKKLKIICPFGY